MFEDSFVHREVRDEYLRWMKRVGDDDPYVTKSTTGIHEVLKAHFLIVDYFCDQQYGLGGAGPRDLELLHSAVYRQFVAFGGVEKWDSSLGKLASLFYGLVSDHPFHDANKRTALLIAIHGLQKLGRTPKLSQKDLENFVVDVADHKIPTYQGFERITKGADDPEIYFIAHFFHRNTRAIDSMQRTVTFHELDRILRRHGFALSNPQGNFIDLIGYEKRRTLLGFGKETSRPYFLAQIGFPGWKSQVNAGALKTVRDCTDLTGPKGVDSKSFFEGVEPLYSLIDQYADPLRRLADR